MKRYTVILLASTELIDGKPDTYMSGALANDPKEAAQAVKDEQGGMPEPLVIAVIEGDHDDVYPHNED